MSGADANARWQETVSSLGGRSEYERVWNLFLEGARHPPGTRPAHISMASTREELIAAVVRRAH